MFVPLRETILGYQCTKVILKPYVCIIILEIISNVLFGSYYYVTYYRHLNGYLKIHNIKRISVFKICICCYTYDLAFKNILISYV